MNDPRSAQRAPDTAGAADDPQHELREMGARSHQLRAAMRAADHYLRNGGTDASHTGSWLVSSALDLARDLTVDIDSLARTVKERTADAGLQQRVAALRVRAHQLQAATQAADHFLDQETRDDRETGSWLVATALGLASKLASEMDDSAVPVRRPGAERARAEGHEAGQSRPVAAAAR